MEIGDENELLCDVNETIFVAVGTYVFESKSLLSWVLKSFYGKKICILHVHQPPQSLTFVDLEFMTNGTKPEAIKALEEREKHKMHELLNQYHLILAQAGVRGDKIWIEMDSIEKGIVEMIWKHKIRWLVMGAAADKYYSIEMTELKSMKARNVCLQAPSSCHIWFCCKGCLIFTRNRGIRTEIEGTETSEQVKPMSRAHEQQTVELPSNRDWEDGLQVARSDNVGSLIRSITVLPSEIETRGTTSLQICKSDAEEGEESGRISMMPTHMGLEDSTGSTSAVYSSLLALVLMPEVSLHHSPAIALLEENTEERKTSELYDSLDTAKKEAKTSKQASFDEWMKRWKAEEDAKEAIKEANTAKDRCTKELNQVKEVEEIIATMKKRVKWSEQQLGEYMQTLCVVRNERPILETQLVELCSKVEDLNRSFFSLMEHLKTAKENQDKIRVETRVAIDEVIALREDSEQRRLEKELKSSNRTSFYVLSLKEVSAVTDDFNPSSKIGEGRYGSVYQGLVRHVRVAIKMLPSHASQSQVQFQHEVEALSMIRHPNLVMIIGVCPEYRSIIYEHLPNGSLEDRLSCKDSTPPLPWQTRTCIAAEICSALVFFHTNDQFFVHGNLKPSNVLLDANFISKVGDLGISGLVPPDFCDRIDANGFFPHMDPEFFVCGELTRESDVYSFGLIMLQLLTGKSVLESVRDVRRALENETLNEVLDSSAGEWPLVQAELLARLGLRCCEQNRYDRADIFEILSMLEPLKDSCTASPLCLDAEEQHRVPSYFLCPIMQEVMENPYIAADGFSYEGEAIIDWFERGHNTSPMTNVALPHCDLLPNNALSEAIRKWRQ